MKEITKRAQGLAERARERGYGLAAAVTVGVCGTMLPTVALADNAAGILENIKTMLQGGLAFVGGAMVVFGGVTIGINVHGSAQGNGGAIASGVAVLVGGAIVAAAAMYFGSLDISWAS